MDRREGGAHYRRIGPSRDPDAKTEVEWEEGKFVYIYLSKHRMQLRD